MYLIQQGVLTVSDADDAVSCGPGLRWSVMGPSLQWHLGGGPGRIKHFMEHLMPGLESMIKNLGTPEITDELKQTIRRWRFEDCCRSLGGPTRANEKRRTARIA